MKLAPCICQDKQRLFDAYAMAAKIFSDSLAQVQSTINIISPQEYDAIYKRIDGFLMDTRMAREELELHVLRHRC